MPNDRPPLSLWDFFPAIESSITGFGMSAPQDSAASPRQQPPELDAALKAQLEADIIYEQIDFLIDHKCDLNPCPSCKRLEAVRQVLMTVFNS